MAEPSGLREGDGMAERRSGKKSVLVEEGEEEVAVGVRLEEEAAELNEESELRSRLCLRLESELIVTGRKVMKNGVCSPS